MTKTTKSKTPADKKAVKKKKTRGKNPDHILTSIEEALDLDHTALAMLIAPDALSPQAVSDICAGRRENDTPALKNIWFPFTKEDVSDIISGDNKGLWPLAKQCLRHRLGVIYDDLEPARPARDIKQFDGKLCKEGVLIWLNREKKSRAALKSFSRKIMKDAQEGLFFDVERRLAKVPPPKGSAWYPKKKPEAEEK